MTEDLWTGEEGEVIWVDSGWEKVGEADGMVVHGVGGLGVNGFRVFLTKLFHILAGWKGFFIYVNLVITPELSDFHKEA